MDRQSSGRIAATLTPQHLLLTRSALFDGGLRPHLYCLPLLKREADRKALIAAATSGDARFFLGTDSAPHARAAKESDCGCAGVFSAHAGIELWNFWGALILLGIGWNFGFIGSTAIVAASYRPSEADKVQGFNDIILFSCVALSSFASGAVFSAFGWAAMILPVWPLAVTGLVLLFLLSRQGNAVERAV